jgi:hypothetical protein
MATLTTKSTNGTSFQGHTVTCSVNDLIAILGEPQYRDNNGRDKTNYEWECMTDDEDVVFSIYDWKEYRPIAEDENIKWHIGAHSEMKSIDAFCEVSRMLGHMY